MLSGYTINEALLYGPSENWVSDDSISRKYAFSHVQFQEKKNICKLTKIKGSEWEKTVLGYSVKLTYQ